MLKMCTTDAIGVTCMLTFTIPSTESFPCVYIVLCSAAETYCQVPLLPSPLEKSNW